MRPNEHKQKRSNQYKKKHGMKTGEQGKNPSKSNDKSSKFDIKKKETSGSAPVAGAAGGNSLDSDRQTSRGSFDKKPSDLYQSEDSFRGKQQFKRREIASNWDKYDLPPEEDEHVTLRGADFQSLLDAASTAVSQFQFEEEKDWDKENDIDFDGWMTIDCKALAKSMLTLPLHERLGLDEKYFTKEQIEFFIKDAKQQKKDQLDNEECVIQDKETEAPFVPIAPSVKDDFDDLLDDLLEGKSGDSKKDLEEPPIDHKKVDRIEGQVQEKPEAQDKDDVIDDIDDLLSDKDTGVQNDETESHNIGIEHGQTDRTPLKEQTSVQNVLSQDLQAADSNKENISSISISGVVMSGEKCSVKEDNKENITNLEDELDDLLDLDQTAEPKKSHSGKDTEGVLDDWLDSMLED